MSKGSSGAFEKAVQVSCDWSYILASAPASQRKYTRWSIWRLPDQIEISCRGEYLLRTRRGWPKIAASTGFAGPPGRCSTSLTFAITQIGSTARHCFTLKARRDTRASNIDPELPIDVLVLEGGDEDLPSLVPRPMNEFSVHVVPDAYLFTGCLIPFSLSPFPIQGQGSNNGEGHIFDQ